jgi:hypothetical protein
MNNLELVNGVIVESGVDLAELTSANFAAPPDKMFTRIKRMVRQANKQMQLERDEYFTRVKEGVALVSPRFEFYDYLDLVPTTLPEGVAVSAETEHDFTTAPAIFSTATTGFSDITAVDGTAVGIDNQMNFQLKIGENILYPDATAPDASTRFKRWGTYNFTDQNATLDTILTDVSDIHLDTMRYTVDSLEDAGNRPIQYVPLFDFPDHCWYDSPGQPRVFTQDATGRYAFWPHPAFPIRLRFKYTASVEDLILFDDEPTWLRTQWHEAIMWLAVKYFAEYIQNPALEQRAYRRWNNTKQQMERNEMPTAGFNPVRMW